MVTALGEALKGVDITLFLGSWCKDSKREVPRFFKILDAADYNGDVELIAVDRRKKTPENLQKGKDIKRVPTMIFKKDGEEIGRIVEYPVESLEKDIQKILSGQAYTHAYER